MQSLMQRIYKCCAGHAQIGLCYIKTSKLCYTTLVTRCCKLDGVAEALEEEVEQVWKSTGKLQLSSDLKLNIYI